MPEAHIPLADGRSIPLTTPEPRVLLRRASRDLLVSLRSTLLTLLEETPQSEVDKRFVLEGHVADITEELGGGGGAQAAAEPKQRTIRTLDGREMVVR